MRLSSALIFYAVPLLGAVEGGHSPLLSPQPHWYYAAHIENRFNTLSERDDALSQVLVNVYREATTARDEIVSVVQVNQELARNMNRLQRRIEKLEKQRCRCQKP